MYSKKKVKVQIENSWYTDVCSYVYSGSVFLVKTLAQSNKDYTISLSKTKTFWLFL